jgi:tetratricopeptide (TPR) repeat protein
MGEPSTHTAPDEGLWDYDDPAGSEARFNERLAALADEPALRAELLTQIARAQGLQRRFDDGHRTLDSVATELDRLRPRAVSRYFLERGRLHRSAGRPEEAHPLFLQAWEIARSHGEDAEAIDAAHMLALVAPPEAQLEWNLCALDLAERTADPRGRQWLGSLRNNIGWAYHEQGAFEQALEQFERALAWREQRGQPRETRIARWCVGRALRSLGRVEAALALQRGLHAEAALASEPDGYVEEELGELLLLTEGPEAARSHFATAYGLLSQDSWLAAGEPERLSRLKSLGGFTDDTRLD